MLHRLKLCHGEDEQWRAHVVNIGKYHCVLLQHSGSHRDSVGGLLMLINLLFSYCRARMVDKRSVAEVSAWVCD